MSGERCPKSRCAYPMPHEHTPATADAAVTVEAASRVYNHALADYEGALVSRDPERRSAAEARLQDAARVLSQAQARRVAERQGVTLTWDALLSDPTQQLDGESVVIASIPAIPPPDAGDVLWSDDRYRSLVGYVRHSIPAGQAVADLDALLAATADRVRREVAEGIAAAIEDAASVTNSGPFANHWTGMQNAARIAREAGNR